MHTRIIYKKCISFFKNGLAICVSLLIWLAVYVLIYAAFTAISIIQETNDWLEIIFREVFCSAVGGYLALCAVKTWIPSAKPNFVFWGFSLFVFTFMTAAHVIGISYCLLLRECTFSWSEQTGTSLAGIAAIFGARLAYNSKRNSYS